MGMMMSIVGMGKGMPQSPQMLNMVTRMLYEKFTKKEIQSFQDFHSAFLDMFNVINAVLPGRHYDVPAGSEIEEYFEKWQKSSEEEKEDVFVKFMMDRVNLSKLDNSTVITGLMTPPAAMAAKKTGENLPQMSIIKAIPDVIFVPSITVLALISAKLYRKVIQGNSVS